MDDLNSLRQFVDQSNTDSKRTRVSQFLYLVLIRRLVNEDDAKYLKYHAVENPADPEDIQIVPENLFTFLVMQNVPVTYDIVKKAPSFPAVENDVDVNTEAQA